MPTPPTSVANLPLANAAPPRLLGVAVFALVLVAAIFFSYRRSLDGPLVFDDTATIVENATIRDFRTAWNPPDDRGLPVTGRPLVNVSFAANYARGGIAPRGYRVVNLALHACTALLLFGLVWRTVRLATVRGPFAASATGMAATAAFLWALHPLQTAAVSYISQRAELLMGFSYVLTLYAFARGTEESRARANTGQPGGAPLWFGISLAACATGMAAKEVMVSAPLIVLLYDRTFVAGSFRDAWRARWPWHLALMATWSLLAWLVLNASGRAGTAGFGLGLTPWAYAAKQCDAIIHYLRLALWPDPLVFDYGGTVLVENARDVLPPAALLAVLVGATAVALWRKPVAGFMGATFFAILAPTSSFVPIADTMFEHRMYLPLALLAIGLALGMRFFAGRVAFGCAVLLAIALADLTVRRNLVYTSELALWRDTAAKRPASVRAHYTLGSVLAQEGRVAEAIVEYQRALDLKPDSAEAHNNLGNALVRLGRSAEAVPHYEAALTKISSADTHTNFGAALFRLGRVAEARTQLETAVKLRPESADAHNNLGNLFAQSGDFAAAEEHYLAALRARPDLADAHANLGNVLAQGRRFDDAFTHYDAALRLRPDFVDARFNLGITLMELRRWREAIAQFQAVLRLRPDYGGASDRLARAEAMEAVYGK